MVISAQNAQILSDAYFGVDRKNIYIHDRSAEELTHGMATEVPLTIGMLTLPPLLYKPLKPYVTTIFDKWHNEVPLSWSQQYQQTYSRLQYEQETRAAELKHLKYADPANGKNKFGIFKRWKNLYRYNAIEGLEAQINNQTSILKQDNVALADKRKYQNAEHAKKYYEKAERLIKEAKEGKLTGTELKAKYKEILKAMQQGDIKMNAAKALGIIKPTSTRAKVMHYAKRYSGYYKTKGFILKSKTTANALRGSKTALKAFGKAGVIFAVAAEALAEYPNLKAAKEIDKQERAEGRKSNVYKKQIKQSSIKAGCAIGGSILGAMGAGAAVGAACGSVAPGIGTLIGFVGGAIGGLIGTFIGKKITGGKTEVEKYQQRKNIQQKILSEKFSKEIRTNDKAGDELLLALNEAKEQGELTDKKIINILDAELKERQKELGENFIKTDYNIGALINEKA